MLAAYNIINVLCVIASFVNSLWALPPLCTVGTATDVGTAAALYCMLCTVGTATCMGMAAVLFCRLCMHCEYHHMRGYCLRFILHCGYSHMRGYCRRFILYAMHCGYCHKCGYCRRFILYAIYALRVLPQAWVLPPLYTVCYICTAGTATSMGTAAALYCMLYMHCGYCHKRGYCRCGYCHKRGYCRCFILYAMNCSDAPIIGQISDIRLISIITKKKSNYQCRRPVPRGGSDEPPILMVEFLF